ncbi:MAG TPA: hypothetical protein VEM41_01065 [Actinomycetota bacterium]|nr:hypothetical protein [Actinomycetota bacterium]
MVYLPFARLRYRRVPNRIVDPATELVIEGFQRSGNTFAAAAFDLAQGRPVKTAHHLHSSAQVLEALRFGVPVLLLIRDPKDTVISHVIREPCVTMRQSLSAWIRFYGRLLPVADRLFVADFTHVSSDFGAVIRDLNVRFGTGYKEFDHTDENVARCFEAIEERNRARFGTIVEGKVARPSEERGARKAQLVAQFDAPGLASMRERAFEVYRAFVPVGSEP